MTNDEMIKMARTAGSVSEILSEAEKIGVKDMTEEEAEKIYKRFHTSGELSDEELDISAGGCGDVSYSNTCPKCGGTMQQVGFMVRDPNYGTRTTTMECDTCYYSYDIVYYE